MNKAESEKIASFFEACGYAPADDPRDADIIVVNTCVVRQSAENRIIGHLGHLKGIKRERPETKIILTGCFVHGFPDQIGALYPHVDCAFRPGEFKKIQEWAKSSLCGTITSNKTFLPAGHTSPCAYVPIIEGCNNFCSYCIVPYRRGRERSRSITDVLDEVTSLAAQGITEITLLGQNVNSYGKDIGMEQGLSELLKSLNNIPELLRIRFLTNHPKDMTPGLIETISGMEKVCKHINIPFQAGDNEILHRMRRGYTREQYIDLIESIRKHIPAVSLSTDIIVGFPGETEEQFQRSVDMLRQIRFDSAHVAAYSVRTGTIAAKKYIDDIPSSVKKERLNCMETLQERISAEINLQLVGKKLEVLVEGDKKNKWFGRAASDKLVFFESTENCIGRLVNVTIVKSSPWSLQGEMAAG